MGDPMLILTAYLHQDWADEFIDLNDALRALKEREPQTLVDDLNARIRGLLSQKLDDERLSEIVDDHVHFNYKLIMRMDARKFLETVVSILGQSN